MDLVLTIGFIIAILAFMGVKIVPQQKAWVVETLGKYDRVLQPGLNFLIPFVQKIAYRHSLKEQALPIQRQAAITKDNVTLTIDGVLYVKIVDPKSASYGVNDPYFALSQLAQTTMRSEIGKIILDKTFEERESLNIAIVKSINEAASAWGIQCMRYEIKDIEPPSSVLNAMELQVAAERKKRADILESEGKREAQINISEAEKRRVVLSSEAAQIDQINRAKGEAEAILAVAEATAQGISKVAASLDSKNAKDAVALKVADNYIEAFSKLAKQGNTLILPANTADAGSMIASALGIYDSIKKAGNSN